MYYKIDVLKQVDVTESGSPLREVLFSCCAGGNYDLQRTVDNLKAFMPDDGSVVLCVYRKESHYVMLGGEEYKEAMEPGVLSVNDQFA